MFFFFFGSNLSCSQSGDHPKADLAEFGYKINMKKIYLRTLYFTSQGFFL